MLLTSGPRLSPVLPWGWGREIRGEVEGDRTRPSKTRTWPQLVVSGARAPPAATSLPLLSSGAFPT